MSTSIPPMAPSNFQRGMPGLTVPPFQRGDGSLGRMGQDDTYWHTNTRIHKDYTCLALNRLEATSTYLEKSFVFSWSKEHSRDIAREIATTIFNQYGARSRPDGQIPVIEKDGPVQNPVIVAVNLPILNWLLATYSNKCDVSKYFDRIHNNPQLEAWIIPPIEEIQALIWPIGGCVNTKATDEVTAAMANGGQMMHNGQNHVRVVCHNGAVDIRDFWGILNYNNSGSNEYTRVPVGERVGWMIKPVLTSSYVNSDLLSFKVDQKSTLDVINTKEVIWQCVPCRFGDADALIKEEFNNTISKKFLVKLRQSEVFEVDGVKYDTVLKDTVYKPYFMSCGKIGAAGSGKADDSAFKQSEIDFDKMGIFDDPSKNAAQIDALPIIELHGDALAPRWGPKGNRYNY